MARDVSESTEALLEAFKDDLQRQLRRSAAVERVDVREAKRDHVTLVATVRVAAHQVELIGTGDTVVDAYANLFTGAQAELILASAYRQMLEPARPSGQFSGRNQKVAR